MEGTDVRRREREQEKQRGMREVESEGGKKWSERNGRSRAKGGNRY